MKRKLKSLMAILVMIIGIVGCGNEQSSVTTPIVDTDNIESGAAYENYLNGKKLIEEAESVTINSTLSVHMQAVSEDDPDADAKLTDTTYETNFKEDRKNKESHIAEFVINSDANGEKMTLNGFYQNECVYYTAGEEKVKEDMSYDLLMQNTGMYDININEEVIATASCYDAENGGKQTSISFDNEKIPEMIKECMPDLTDMLDLDDEDTIINYGNIEYVTNSDGIMKSVRLVLDVTFQTGDYPTGFNIYMNREYSDINSTEIVIPENLEDYQV